MNIKSNYKLITTLTPRPLDFSSVLLLLFTGFGVGLDLGLLSDSALAAAAAAAAASFEVGKIRP